MFCVQSTLKLCTARVCVMFTDNIKTLKHLIFTCSVFVLKYIGETVRHSKPTVTFTFYVNLNKSLSEYQTHVSLIIAESCLLYLY